MGDKIVFAAKSTEGIEPWISDGTEAGTMLLKNISTSGDSKPRSFVPMNGKIYFIATGDAGDELWATDGTPAGTSIVMDINPGNASSMNSSSLLAVKGNQLFFIATSNTGGPDLWTSDGTAEGTKVVKQLKKLGWTGDGRIYVAGNWIYFTAAQGSVATTLWASNGTADGTAIISYSTFGHTNIQSIDGALYFKADANIYRSRGTTATTHPIGQGTPVSPFYVVGTRLCFLLDDPDVGQELFRIELPGKDEQQIEFTAIANKKNWRCSIYSRSACDLRFAVNIRGAPTKNSPKYLPKVL